ncbi:hypothetical protein [Micromonospora sonneratiae]|uniref:Uncharacterized protein n=1 Tax=Micromonospora sonneratiae TaxID=1184706 RepID=A0ABW3YE84_9ACTN
MTSQPEPTPTDANQASQVTKPLRELAALVLVGANAVMLLVGLIEMMVPDGEWDSFQGRAGSAFSDFVGILAIGLPLLAVLLATHVQPVVSKAKLVTMIALVEYAVSALFGIIAMFSWVIISLNEGQIRIAFFGLLSRICFLAIFGIAAFAVFKLFSTLYYVSKPKVQPGMYGQPQQGYPAGYPQGYGQPQAYGQPTAYGQPQAYGQPGMYGQPAAPAQPGAYDSQAAASATQYVPQYPAPGLAPQSAPPAPQSAPPAPQSAPPAAAPQMPEATQVIPPSTGEAGGGERTQYINPSGQ